MLKSISLFAIILFFSCGSGKEPSSLKSKVVCSDSVEVEQFDSLGNPFMVRIPGKCDTIVEANSH
ncbi:MAG TPA: hypothetical protein PLU73_06025 [Bacteroidia bacterium]|nr:hypothetical protein [Bacteroidia bacterium]